MVIVYCIQVLCLALLLSQDPVEVHAWTAKKGMLPALVSKTLCKPSSALNSKSPPMWTANIPHRSPSHVRATSRDEDEEAKGVLHAGKRLLKKILPSSLIAATLLLLGSVLPVNAKSNKRSV